MLCGGTAGEQPGNRGRGLGRLAKPERGRSLVGEQGDINGNNWKSYDRYVRNKWLQAVIGFNTWTGWLGGSQSSGRK